MDQPTDERDEFDFVQAAQEVLDVLPPELRGAMSNVTIVVDDEPPPGQPLLGLYQGVPLTRRTSGYVGALPDKITSTPVRSSASTARRGSLWPRPCATSCCTRSPTTSASATSA